jgi:hypothetical protein
MKTDPIMIKAVMNIAKRQYDEKVSPEARTLGAFAANVLLPLMTERANTNAYKSARRGLIDRGRNPNEHG